MAPRAIFALAAVVLVAATAQASHGPSPEGYRLAGCVTVGWWPLPPYVGVGECDHIRVGVYLNGTAVGWHLP